MFSSQRFLRSGTRKGYVRYFRFPFKKYPNFDDAVKALKNTYEKKLLPLEKETHFHRFQSLQLNDVDFESPAAILLIGQYSTGKTTMIRHILQTDYPGIRIGPEPTTDRFITIMHDDKARVIPGNALVSDKTKPFGHLAAYGNAFLTKFQCSTVPSPILKRLYIVDTPGILSGEKQRVDRGYDFIGVLEWFAERVDRIILLFDANKLDISDEFRNAIQALKGNEEKIHILLNKADAVDQNALMRVYGSLLWSLGKVFNTPEVMRVFIGSFWDKPLINSEFRPLFEREERALLEDIQSLPTTSILRKLNDLSKRARQVLVHASIMKILAKNMPNFIGKESAKSKLVDHLQTVFEEAQQEFNISKNELPNLAKTQAVLKDMKAALIKSPSQKLIDQVEEMLSVDITRIMALIEEDPNELQDGVFKQMEEKTSPFAFNSGVGFDAGRLEHQWIVEKFRSEADNFFDGNCADNGKLARADVRQELLKTGLPNKVLGEIYILSDIDGDGLLDRDEYALARYIVKLKQEGFDVPSELPKHLIPPSKL